MPTTTAAPPAVLTRSDRVIVFGGLGAVALAGVTRFVDLGSVTAFAVSAVAVALLASLVGRSVEQLGDRFGAGATGVLQSALGNLPELFIGIFALRAGLVQVVQAAIIGSILGNILLVLGLAFLVGGLKHGRQKFNSTRARTAIAMLILAVAAMVIPSLAHDVHSAAARHEQALSSIVAVVLLVVFACSVPASLRRDPNDKPDHEAVAPRWPLWLAVGLLTVASVLAALVSDWFVHALTPAIEALNISQAFAGLVIVAIAGNAVENVVGIQLAARNQADYALSVIINSPLQIALVLAPVLVLISTVIGGATLTLVFAPMLVAAVALSVITTAFIIIDGESIWLEGAALLGLYGVIAASFWWG
ncbi:MAG: calcium/proton exchanger [Pseudonocardiales bacterium]